MTLDEGHPLGRLILQAERDVRGAAETYHSGQAGHARRPLQLVLRLIEAPDVLATEGLRRAIDAVSNLSDEISGTAPPGDPVRLRRLTDEALAAIHALRSTLARSQPTAEAYTLGLAW